MNTETPQTDLDMNDPYQVYIYMMLVVVCDSCETYLDIVPPYGETDSWDWYRVAAKLAREAGWLIGPTLPNGDHPMTCFCSLCKPKAEPSGSANLASLGD